MCGRISWSVLITSVRLWFERGRERRRIRDGGGWGGVEGRSVAMDGVPTACVNCAAMMEVEASVEEWGTEEWVRACFEALVSVEEAGEVWEEVEKRGVLEEMV